jgi:peptidoglycan/xylan/chitin deacetylase (PgdA/CDA1 family)
MIESIIRKIKSQTNIVKFLMTGLFALLVISCDQSHYKYSRQPAAGLFLSFDDYCIDEWFALRELFSKYDGRVTFYVTKFDTLTDSQVEKLRLLQQDGHEIGFHGAHHVLSEHYIKAHSFREYFENEIHAGIKTMNARGFFPTSFAYPYSAKYWGTDTELLKYFHTIRSSVPFKGELVKMHEAFYNFQGKRIVNAVSIDQGKGIDITQIAAAFQKIKSDKTVLMLHGHEPGHDFDPAFLEEILKLAKKEKIIFFRASDLVL